MEIDTLVGGGKQFWYHPLNLSIHTKNENERK